MLETLTLSSKGQIVIPERVRKRLKLKIGSRLVLIEKNNELILKKEDDFLKRLDINTADLTKDNIGWLSLAEQSLTKLWNNSDDEHAWKKYL